jgi:hypothetical protein
VYRPTIAVAECLQQWLSLRTRSHYVGTLQGPVADVKKMMHGIRADAGLDDAVSAYSARHTMARELRKRHVPADEIELMLGHRRPNQGTTGINARYDPDYCSHAVAAIDEVFAALDGILGCEYFRVSFERVKADAERFAKRRVGSGTKVVGTGGIEPPIGDESLRAPDLEEPHPQRPRLRRLDHADVRREGRHER